MRHDAIPQRRCGTAWWRSENLAKGGPPRPRRGRVATHHMPPGPDATWPSSRYPMSNRRLANEWRRTRVWVVRQETPAPIRSNRYLATPAETAAPREDGSCMHWEPSFFLVAGSPGLIPMTYCAVVRSGLRNRCPKCCCVPVKYEARSAGFMLLAAMSSAHGGQQSIYRTDEQNQSMTCYGRSRER